MKLGNLDFIPREGSHESFKDWRPDKVQQLSGDRIKLTAGSSWSAGITTLEPMPLGTLTVEFDCRVMALDPCACLAIWRYNDNGDEYDDVEFSQWGDANNLYGITNTLWSAGAVVPANDTNERNLAQSRGFRRWAITTTESQQGFSTSIDGWWNSEGIWIWKRVAYFESFKPSVYQPGPLRIALWVPKRGLLYPASASAPLVATLQSLRFDPLVVTSKEEV